ncbi:unknown [Prevotella sp. CAG:520]|nr:unknown [Prevotella sp. CAG:520]
MILLHFIIVLRTQTDWTPNANELDSEREPIGWRTRTDWMANANGTNLRLFTHYIIVNLLNGDVIAGLQCTF